MRIAYFCPAQLADSLAYDQALLPELARQVEVERFVQAGSLGRLSLVPQLPAFEETALAQRHRASPYDLVLYRIGDHPAYRFAWEALCRWPGVVSLQSMNLHPLLAIHPSEPAYEQAMVEEYGEEGRSLARYRAIGLAGAVDGEVRPLGRFVAARALGAIVHTAEALALLRKGLPDLPAALVRRPVSLDAPVAPGDLATIRQRFHLGPEELVLTSFGAVARDWRERLARVYGRLLGEDPTAVLLIVAEGPVDASLWEEALSACRLLGAARVIEVGDHAALLAEMIAVTDIALYLHLPALGEMPELPPRLMAAGKVVLFPAARGLAEFPEDCCVQISAGAQGEELLWAYLQFLAGRPEVRQRLGENAREYARQAHAPAAAADTYRRLLEEVWALLQRRQALPLRREPDLEGVRAGVSAAQGQEEGVPASGALEGIGEIDVEQIMRQVRRQVGQKYLVERAPLPEFDPYRSPPTIRKAGEVEMLHKLQEASRNWELPVSLRSSGRLSREEILLALNEVCSRQATFNGNVVQVLYRLIEQVYDPARDLELTALRYQVEALYQQLMELESARDSGQVPEPPDPVSPPGQRRPGEA